MSHSILSNTFIASVGRFFNVLLGLVITVIITRYLGHERFGLYSLLLAYGTLLSVLADFGLYLTLTREISQHPEKENFYISHITTMRLALLAAVFLTGIGLSFLIPSLRELWLLLVVAAIGYIAQSMSQLLMGVYQKYGLMWRVAVGDLVGRLIQFSTILILLWWIVNGVNGSADFSLMIVVAAFSLGAVSAYVLHRMFLPIKRKLSFTFDWIIWKEIFNRTWPLGAMLLVNAVYFRIDVLVLSFFRDAGEVGWYSLAYRVIESSLFFPAMFGGLVLPRLSGLLADNNLFQVRGLVKESLQFLTAIGALAFVLLLFLATPLLVWLSGEEFAPAGQVLQVLGGALGVMFLGNLFGFVLVALEKQKTLLFLYLGLAVFNLAANLVFIPFYGAMGAAWTTVATEFLAAGIAAVLVWRAIRYQVAGAYLGKLLLIAAATGLFILIMPAEWHVVARGGLAAGVYCLLGLFLGLIRRDNIGLLLYSKPDIAK